MRALEKGTYSGKVLDLSQADGLLAGATSYQDGDDSALMHFHENSHLSFVLQGGGTEKRRHSEVERLPGQMMFFHAGEPHQSISKLFPAKNINLEIESTFLQENAATESTINASIIKNPNAKFIMLKIYKELLAEDNFSACSIKMLLLNLIHAGSERELRTEPPAWINIVSHMLNDRWNENLTLNDLAAAAHVHPITISKYFPKYFSCTLGEYMRRLKIEKSLYLIKASSFSLTEIAFECGFSDQSHFTRTFKNLTGFLPTRYAKL
jgi:AraC family transcriptional regulator